MRLTRFCLILTVASLCNGCLLLPVDYAVVLSPITVRCRLPESYRAKEGPVLIGKFWCESDSERTVTALLEVNDVQCLADYRRFVVEVDSNNCFERKFKLDATMIGGPALCFMFSPPKPNETLLIAWGTGRESEIVQIDLWRKNRAQRYHHTMMKFVEAPEVKVKMVQAEPRILEVVIER